MRISFFVKDLKTNFVLPDVTCSKGVPSSGFANCFIMLLLFKQDTELFASLKYELEISAGFL